MKLDIDSLFATPEKTARANTGKRLYDVRITLNKKGGKSRMNIRFGLFNAAANEGKKHEYAEVSTDTEIMKNRLYFRFHKEKNKRQCSQALRFDIEERSTGRQLVFHRHTERKGGEDLPHDLDRQNLQFPV